MNSSKAIQSFVNTRKWVRIWGIDGFELSVFYTGTETLVLFLRFSITIDWLILFKPLSNCLGPFVMGCLIGPAFPTLILCFIILIRSMSSLDFANRHSYYLSKLSAASYCSPVDCSMLQDLLAFVCGSLSAVSVCTYLAIVLVVPEYIPMDSCDGFTFLLERVFHSSLLLYPLEPDYVSESSMLLPPSFALC